ncbi:MAG: bifunctional [glutamate--ammonia ligase]-adenylyl-L-tyrosine phosphorylase/[glutamate--ammonia-ligase] adenylyltransferase [Betaproteobacteria bacterium]
MPSLPVPPRATDLDRALAYSRYADAALSAHPHDRVALAATLDAPWAWPAARAAIDAQVAAGDPVALAAELRTLRRRLFVHTLARDLTGRAPLAEVCAAMTALAELSLNAAVALHHAALAADHGEPRDDRGEAQALVVIGMGKLGGGELNVSSDVDLVFVYPEDGETDGARPMSNREFFDRLGRRVIGALNDVTADGYVFRVDMRLRPYGESGPLTIPYSALEQYLITQGRAWERYAWLKARALTGTRHAELDALVAPFVFRKYLDYDAYDGLRDIHAQIREQVKRQDYAPNIKLGPGGIREVEFIVQALQIVRGGREPALRARGTLPALAAIGARGLLPGAAVDALHSAYVFLRNVEHRLQYRDDRQTQTLPFEPAERALLAASMGHADATAFDVALAVHRDAVGLQFAAVFGAADGGAPATLPGTATNDAAAPDPSRLAAVWRDDVSADTAQAVLAAAGYDDSEGLAATLARVRSSARYVQLPAASRQRFDTLVPQLLATAAAEPVAGADAQSVFARLLALLEAVSRRSAYLALLIEHPPLLPRLARLMGASQWAADYLTRHPLLLDELLDARVLLAEPDWTAWRAELVRLVADHAGDPERQMDSLRHFQHAHAFRLLAQDLAGTLTVERLADHLSALADTIIQTTLAEVWRQLAGADSPPLKFAVVGYGKLGGKELGYASDLDLVFLYDDADDAAAVRYTRLAQRMVTWLTSTTAAGHLYDTDLRLRPDGAAGLTVSSLAGFRKYQDEQAWTWEHQALTRARFVAGDPAIGAAFEAARDAILRRTRDPVALAADVVLMRRKMHAGHPNATDRFDLKHDPGGMVDVEFAVQYLVLAHAHRHPGLTRNAGNIALLAMAGELALVPAAMAAAAADAYREYRRTQHNVRLTGAAHARVPPDTQQARRAAVAALWTHVFGGPWTDAAA